MSVALNEHFKSLVSEEEKKAITTNMTGEEKEIANPNKVQPGSDKDRGRK
jgi:hypothetical protein